MSIPDFSRLEARGDKIIAHRPRRPWDVNDINHYIVVDRGPGHYHQFVSATVNYISLRGGEWFWGNYFQTKWEALHHFNEVQGR